MTDPATLPIEPVLPDIRRALDEDRRVVVQAPPGAGKTTRVPLALLDRPWAAHGRIVVLEPRRLATRASARRMADLVGDEVGGTVGYVTRDERRVSGRTRVEVVTEGVLVRRLQRDPSLAGTAAVVFDEFHERSLQADLGLALTLEAAAALREDLRIAVMSATLEAERVVRLLGDAPLVESHGREYQVETRYRPRARRDARIEPEVVDAVATALSETAGDVLVFLPGAGEIRRVARGLADAGLDGPGVLVAPLYGALAPDEQDRALDPAPTGVRKVVLATDIAETSLTIDGVRVVVDAGRNRTPRFDPGTGMSQLVTVPVSRASSDQRRGRAGRTAPGVCYRLWSEAEHHALESFTPPQIAHADLAGFALEVAAWGADGPEELALLDPPPARTYAQALALLRDLEAVDDTGRVTDHGRELAELPLHPRLAHLVVRGAALGHGGTAAEVAALLADRDVLRTSWQAPCADLEVRLDVLRGESDPPAGVTVRRGARPRARREADRLRRAVGAGRGSGRGAAGLLLTLAYPDRIAQRRPGARGSFLLSNGRGAQLPPNDPLAGEDLLVVSEIDRGDQVALIRVAAAVTLDELRAAIGHRVMVEEVVAWDEDADDVVAERQERLSELVLTRAPLADPDPDRVIAALLDGVRANGLQLLPWTDEARAWRARVGFLRRTYGDAWPDLSDGALLETLDTWLAPFLLHARRRADLDRVPLLDALRARLTTQQLGRLDALAPTHLTVPSGSRIRLDYASRDQPVLPVRVQELFGAVRTPTVADGRVRVMLRLLSPAQRPVQVTDDLAGFWVRTYPEVRSELRGRYPKHHWPEDPVTARPARGTRPI